MKKLISGSRWSLLFLATLLLQQTSFAVTVSFSDVPNTHDNYVAINYIREEGIAKGYEDGTFKPENILNRAEAMKFVLESIKASLPETATEVSFSDVSLNDWFIKYLVRARELGIVSGNPDGTFAPGRQVTKAEFIKMLLNANGFKTEKWAGQNLYPDVPGDSWYSPYMNYAGQAGIVSKDSNGKLNPAQPMSRGEVAQSVYLLKVILNGSNTQFLLDQSEAQMSQIEVYIGASKPLIAKKASELAVDMTQQAYKNMATNNVVLGAAKLARAYDYVVNAYISALQKKYDEAYQWGQQAISKATEAWEANHDIQAIAKHIKDRAHEIIAQLPGYGTQQQTQQTSQVTQ